MDKNDFSTEDMNIFTHSIGDAILKRDEAYRAIDALIDSAGESWFELGAKLERRKFLDILDNFDKKLLDSEEDAKMTLAVLRELIENAEEEDGGEG